MTVTAWLGVLRRPASRGASGWRSINPPATPGCHAPGRPTPRLTVSPAPRSPGWMRHSRVTIRQLPPCHGPGGASGSRRSSTVKRSSCAPVSLLPVRLHYIGEVVGHGQPRGESRWPRRRWYRVAQGGHQDWPGRVTQRQDQEPGAPRWHIRHCSRQHEPQPGRGTGRVRECTTWAVAGSRMLTTWSVPGLLPGHW